MRGTLPYLLLLFYRLETFCLGFSVYKSLSIHPIYPIYRLYFLLPVYSRYSLLTYLLPPLLHFICSSCFESSGIRGLTE